MKKKNWMKILRSLRQGGENVYPLVKYTFDETTLNLDFVSRPQATMLENENTLGTRLKTENGLWAIVWGRGSAVRRKPLYNM